MGGTLYFQRCNRADTTKGDRQTSVSPIEKPVTEEVMFILRLAKDFAFVVSHSISMQENRLRRQSRVALDRSYQAIPPP